MAMSEVFNLDFKFGGNAEFLVKLESLLQRIDSRFDSFEDDVKDSTKATEDMADAVDDLNDSFKRGLGAMSEFGDRLKDIAKYYLSFTAIRAGAERVWSFGMRSMDAFATQERAENQLKGVMKNRGTLNQFQTIKDYAAQIQGRSIYGDEAMIRGAGELATYVKGTESLKSMMSLLTDYAAGMTGGGEVSPEQMESLATGLGMAYDGNYMAMRRKGFDTSKLEALDALAENGGVWNSKLMQKYGKDWDDEQKKEWAGIVKEAKKAGGITEQMRVDALKESLGDWAGLSDEVNKLNSSALIRFQNKLGDLREEIGEKLYPVFNELVESIERNMPTIRRLFESAASIFQSLAKTLSRAMPYLSYFGEQLAKIVEVFASAPVGISLTVGSLKALSPVLMSVVGETTVMGQAIKGLGGKLAITAAAVWGFFEILKAGELLLKVGEESARGREIKKASSDLESWRNVKQNYPGKIAEMESIMRDMDNPGTTDEALVNRIKAFGEKYGEDFKGGGFLADMFLSKGESRKLNLNANRFNRKEARSVFDKMRYLDIQDLNVADERIKDADARYRKAVALPTTDMSKFWKTPDYGPDFDPNKALNDIKNQLASEAKGDLHQTFNNTNIEQKVNVAAEVEKIGMLLNFSVRAAIEQAMRQNKNQVAVGAI